ncbi:MAG: fused DSP-PTPase phosphatase/NAD kinase-like protein [Acidimicrobiia bacterium]
MPRIWVNPRRRGADHLDHSHRDRPACPVPEDNLNVTLEPQVTSQDQPATRRGRPTRTVLRALAVAAALILTGNLAILAASMVAQGSTAKARIHEIPGIDHLEAVDGKLWRGGAPSNEGYRGLAGAGVTTIVDLRAEEGIEPDLAYARSLGIEVVHIPIRDGQTPTADQVEAFMRATERSPGPVFVHCGAGVGRTGTMVGAYVVSTGELNGRGAVRRNLAVGPPSLEQIVFVTKMERGEIDRPGVAVQALSRVLDGPRRIWHRLGL